MRAAGRLFNTIKIFFEVQDYENVIKYSKQFLNTPNMEVNPALFYYYGVSLLKTNNIPQALESFEQAYDRGANCITLANIGRTLVSRGYQFESIKYFEKAIQDPNYNNWLGYFLLGKAYFFCGNNELAIKNLETAMILAGEDKDKTDKIKNILAKAKASVNKGIQKIDYQAYIKMGGSIKSGSIVDLQYGSQAISQNSSNTDITAKPYFVLCNEDNIIYAIALTNSQKFGIGLTNTNPNNPNYFTGSAISFKQDYIKSVITDKSLTNPRALASKIYHYLCRQDQSKLESSQIALIEAFNRTLKPKMHDIVTICADKEQAKFSHYFIIGEEEEFQAVEVILVNGTFVPTTNYVNIPKDTIIFEKATIIPETAAILLDIIGQHPGLK